jgi:hypothetical protein
MFKLFFMGTAVNDYATEVAVADTIAELAGAINRGYCDDDQGYFVADTTLPSDIAVVATTDAEGNLADFEGSVIECCNFGDRGYFEQVFGVWPGDQIA